MERSFLRVSSPASSLNALSAAAGPCPQAGRTGSSVAPAAAQEGRSLERLCCICGGGTSPGQAARNTSAITRSRAGRASASSIVFS